LFAEAARVVAALACERLSDQLLSKGNHSMKTFALWVATVALLPATISVAVAQTPPPLAATHSQPSVGAAALGSADTYFVTQTAIGTPFQVNAGRIAAQRGTKEAIRMYAQLMVTSHIAVNNTLLAVLKEKAPVPPPTLLEAAYSTMIADLKREHGKRFDADYLRGQVNYQNANAALYQFEIADGTDPDLKAFAQQTLPKIMDHLNRAEKLSEKIG
jgi:putative membrane protein